VTTTLAPPEPAQQRARLSGPGGLVLMWAAVAGCATGVVAGLLAGPLWLDEALSVEISRQPLPDLLAALRRDGSPPLYYLLLHAWIAAFGTGTVVVRLPAAVVTVVALLLAHRLGRRLAGGSGARAAVTALALLPWTMRFGSETRMYTLVVALVLAGALSLLLVRASPSRPAVVALAACVGALLLTHYWSLFLLTAVALWHLPAVLRRDPAALRVAVAGLAGALLFLPWLPTFLFQAAHTGAPWADPPELLELLRTPRYWGGGSDGQRTVLALVLVPLAVLGAGRGAHRGPSRALLGVTAATLVLAWTVTVVGGGAYTGRYTAVVVPLFATAVALGTLALPGRLPLVALGLAAVVGVTTGVQAAQQPRTSAAGIAAQFLGASRPGDLLVYCPDQLGPPVARAIGPGYDQVVYPTLDRPQLVDWVDYAERNAAADPAATARALAARAHGRQLFVLKAAGYRTFGDDCDDLLAELEELRGTPEHLYGELGTTGQLLFRYDA
jgi:mannosyltransferase